MNTEQSITFPAPSAEAGKVIAAWIEEGGAERRAAHRLARSRRINAEKHDRRVMLKIKLIDLAQEARTIKREEQRRHGGWLRTELRDHRIRDVRGEARATHLAYGFVRGHARSRMERDPIAQIYVELRKRVRSLVTKYGPASAAVPDSWFEEKRA